MARMGSERVGRVAEDYLTLIWKAEEWPDDPATTTGIAARVGVNASTVSANLKKLARDGLIDYEAYGSVALTDAGRAIAVAVVRRHRILETYLAERLGYTWDEVHDEADHLEHAVSDTLLARMDEELGHPQVDPHGDPIPAEDGTVAPIDAVPLRDCPTGGVGDRGSGVGPRAGHPPLPRGARGRRRCRRPGRPGARGHRDHDAPDRRRPGGRARRPGGGRRVDPGRPSA